MFINVFTAKVNQSKHHESVVNTHVSLDGVRPYIKLFKLHTDEKPACSYHRDSCFR